MSNLVSIIVEQISNLINSFSNFKFSTSELFIIYFTALGILATIITIGSSLTREWRQDLLIKYLLKKKFVLSYSLYLIFSFVALVLFYSLEYSYLENLSFLLLIILFVWTFIFLALFIKNLDRKSLYKDIYKKFESEVKNVRK